MLSRLFPVLLLCLFFCSQSHAEDIRDISTQLERFIPKGNAEGKAIGYLTIDSEQGISKATWVYIKTALDYFKEQKPLFILLNINTPGGELAACQKIGDALRDMDLKEGIPIVAVINKRALSGGALISYSCRFIYGVEDASMGAATPVFSVPNQGMKKAPEKIVSVVRTEFANAAKLFGRSPVIAEAMVDESLLVVIREGKAKVLLNEEQIGPKDVIVSTSGMLLTLNSDEMIAYHVADGLIPYTLSEEQGAMSKEQWTFSEEALSKITYFEAFLNNKVITKPKDWKVEILVFLSSSFVSSILLLGLLLGVYIEFQTPGFGVAGSIALLCLCLMTLTGFSIDAIHWLEYAFLGIGILLLFLELFVIPGFGVIGAIGIVAFFIGTALLYLPNRDWIPEFIQTGNMGISGQVFLNKLWWFFGTIVVFVILLITLSRFLQKKAQSFSYLVLNSEQNKEMGFESSGGILNELINEEGSAYSSLRPSGKVEINGMFYEALSEGVFVQKGSLVKVIQVRGKTLIVEVIKD